MLFTSFLVLYQSANFVPIKIRAESIPYSYFLCYSDDKCILIYGDVPQGDTLCQFYLISKGIENSGVR